MSQELKFSITKKRRDAKATKLCSFTIPFNLTKLAEVIQKTDWLGGHFKGNYRKKENFIETNMMVYDVDEGFSMADCMKALQDYQHIIIPSGSHQLPKITASGSQKAACDRYRVILPLTEPIADHHAFEATWKAGAALFPSLDVGTKDPSRLWFFCPHPPASINTTGKLFPVVKTGLQHLDTVWAEPEPVKDGDAKSPHDKPKPAKIGRLTERTRRFLVEGAPDGQWNTELFKAAKDCQGQGMTMEDFAKRVNAMAPVGGIDENDKATIRSAFSRPTDDTHRPHSLRELTLLEQDNRERKAILEDRKLGNHLRVVTEGDKTKEIIANSDLQVDLAVEAAKAKKIIEARKRAIPFLLDELSDYIIVAPGSLAVVFAHEGAGKSTFAANFAYRLHLDGLQTLIISNEEPSADVYSKLSCFDMGFSPTDFKKNLLSSEQTRQVVDGIFRFNSTQVIGRDGFPAEAVRSAEGVTSILRKAAALRKFDCVIIDYYQSVDSSTEIPDALPHEAQGIFVRELDQIKDEIGCPIIVMAQIRNIRGQIKERMEGSRQIVNRATDIFEIILDREQNETWLKIHKNRFLGNDDMIQLAFDKITCRYSMSGSYRVAKIMKKNRFGTPPTIDEINEMAAEIIG
jgi:hypothetical protein